AWTWRDADGQPARHGYTHRGVHASYLHLHPAAHPDAVTRFVAAAAAAGRP
ncbi:MAG: cobyrinate a,c-diamide synthase, partial [Gordonia amarae]